MVLRKQIVDDGLGFLVLERLTRAHGHAKPIGTLGPDDSDRVLIWIADDKGDAARGFVAREQLLAFAVESEHDGHEDGCLALTRLAGYEGQLLVKCELSRSELPKVLECQFQHVFYFFSVNPLAVPELSFLEVSVEGGYEVGLVRGSCVVDSLP